ncbi:transmembrane protein 268 isoform X1 [Simochromis diagramma]|uniref:transmembrane protein 268 isoform X1 n=2 Tax=Simochromis diagramma TaxID=43689 RepID=UPI001A7F0741|nr:transmembrane protein 268 isoform X1 [Simochromis diagramma]
MTPEMMEDSNGVCHIVEEREGDVQIQYSRPHARDSINSRPDWSNGQCVASVPSCSMLYPSFNLLRCRAKLEREGFQIPREDMETPLKTALDVPSVRRYMVFNSAQFRFIMAPVLYVVLWCAVFSTLHLYITVSDYWVLCLSVSLISIVLTTAVILILHCSNKEINVNLDIRLVQVNEMLVRHKLLVGVADWVQNCTGNMKLYFVYWDMSPCLRALTETMEELSFATTNTQKKLKSKMSHFVLVTKVSAGESDAEEQDSDEQTPLLENSSAASGRSSNQQKDATATKNYSLVPDAALPSQAKAYQLLVTYSAAYVKLLVSERLSGSSHHRGQRSHCTTAPICLCQYIKTKILQ